MIGLRKVGGKFQVDGGSRVAPLQTDGSAMKIQSQIASRRRLQLRRRLLLLLLLSRMLLLRKR